MALGETSYSPPAPQYPPRKRWTREECEAYQRAGFWDGQHYELINGELINKPKHLPHTLGIRRLVETLRRVFGLDPVLQETSIEVAAEDLRPNEPEPDIIVLRRSTSEIPSKEPAVADIALVAEVSDTTLEHHTAVKAALCARAGIPEYWVSDLNGRRLIVYRDPSGSVYKSLSAYGEAEVVAPSTAPDRVIPVSDLFA